MKPNLLILTVIFVTTALTTYAQKVYKYRASSIYYSDGKKADGTNIWLKMDNASNVLVVWDQPKNKINIYSDTIQDISIIATYNFGEDNTRHIYMYHMNCVDQDNKKCDANISLYPGENNEPSGQLIMDYYSIQYKFVIKPDQ